MKLGEILDGNIWIQRQLSLGVERHSRRQNNEHPRLSDKQFQLKDIPNVSHLQDLKYNPGNGTAVILKYSFPSITLLYWIWIIMSSTILISILILCS